MDATEQVNAVETGTELEASQAVVERVLSPYKLRCRYLLRATAERNPCKERLVAARGEFAIPESCYIAATGHFNAVEFNICYNQLAYCLMAVCIEHTLLHAFSRWNLNEFSRRQLSDFLIVQFSSSFRKPLKSEAFYGRVEINRISRRQDTIFLKTTCHFDDRCGGESAGGALIAVIGGDASSGAAHGYL
jgi:hypothetical protein